MRRVAPTIPVPPNMLRHFAVLTLVITAGIAMFANGENQSFLADQVRQREMKNEALRAERQRTIQHTVVANGLRIAPGTRLAEADVGDDPAPTTNVLPAESAPMADFMPQRAAGRIGPAGGIGPDGNMRDAKGRPFPPPAMMMRMRGKPGQPQSATGNARPTEQDVNALIDASAQRAGRSSVVE